MVSIDFKDLNECQLKSSIKSYKRLFEQTSYRRTKEDRKQMKFS